VGDKEKAPKGPDWKKLTARIDEFVSQNQDIFKEAMAFGKDQFTLGQQFVDQIRDFGMSTTGKLGEAADAFDQRTGQAIGKMQQAGNRFTAANQQEYDRSRGLADQITGAIMPGIESQAQLGATLTDRYQTQGIAAEDKYLAQLRGWDTPQRREEEAARGAADIAMASGASIESEMRRLEQYGIDPSQTRSASQGLRLGAQQAIAQAAAANESRRRVEAEGLQLGGQAVDISNQSARLGSSMSEAAAGQGQVAAAIGAAPGEAYKQGLGQSANYQLGISNFGSQAGQAGFNMRQGIGQFGVSALGAAAGQQNLNSQYGSGIYDQGSGTLGRSAAMTTGAYQTGGQLNANDIQRVAQNNANSLGGQLGALAGALGPAAIGAMTGNPFAAMAGMSGMGGGGGAAPAQPFQPAPSPYFMSQLAKGGAIPETSSPSRGAIKDDVPAMLSANEYVIPASAKEYYGTKFLDNLVAKAEGIPSKKKAA
jgi:hypothetical protein